MRGENSERFYSQGAVHWRTTKAAVESGMWSFSRYPLIPAALLKTQESTIKVFRALINSSTVRMCGKLILARYACSHPLEGFTPGRTLRCPFPDCGFQHLPNGDPRLKQIIYKEEGQCPSCKNWLRDYKERQERSAQLQRERQIAIHRQMLPPRSLKKTGQWETVKGRRASA